MEISERIWLHWAKECEALQNDQNNKNAEINWQFTTKDARIKLKRLYPALQDWRDIRMYKEDNGEKLDMKNKVISIMAGYEFWDI